MRAFLVALVIALFAPPSAEALQCLSMSGVMYSIRSSCTSSWTVNGSGYCEGTQNQSPSCMTLPGSGTVVQASTTSATTTAAQTTPTTQTTPATQQTSGSTSLGGGLLGGLLGGSTPPTSGGTTPTATAAQTTPTPPPSPVSSSTETVTQTTATPTSTATSADTTNAALTAAQEEAELARMQATELSALMGQIKSQNEQAANFYANNPNAAIDGGAKVNGLPPPVTNLADLKKNSSDISGLGSPASQLNGGALASSNLSSNLRRDLASTSDGPSASFGGTSATGASPSSSNGEDAVANGSASDDPYQSYMAGDKRTKMVDELARRKELRDELRQRIAGLLDDTPEHSEEKQALQAILREAESKPAARETKTIEPLSTEEAFSMNADETDREVRGLLAQMDRSQFNEGLTRSESLFERVKSAHDRSLRHGFLRISRKGK